MNGKTIAGGMLTMLAVLSLSAQNLVVNSGFEEDSQKWQTPKWILQSANGSTYIKGITDAKNSQGPVGQKSLRINHVQGKYRSYLTLEENLKLDPKLRNYTLSCWVRSEAKDWTLGKALGILEFHAFFQGKGKANLTKSIVTPWNKTLPEWTHFSVDFTVPAGYDSVKFLLKYTGDKNGTATFWIDNLYCGPKVEKKAEPGVVKKETAALSGIPSAPHGGIYYPGEEISYRIKPGKNIPAGKRAELTWQVFDFEGAKLAEGRTSVMTESTLNFKLPLPKDFLGYYTVRAELSMEGKHCGSGLFSGFLIEPLNGKADPFFSNRSCSSVEKYRRMGFGAKLLTPGSGITWSSQIEKGKNNFKWYDELLKKHRAEGYENIYANTYFTNYVILPGYSRKEYRLKLKSGIDPFTESDYEDYRWFCREAISRYGNTIREWRVNDEIGLTRHNNIFVIEQYPKFGKIFSEELRKLHPEAKLYAGGLIFGDPHSSEYLPLIWEKIKDSVDGLCVDMYSQGAGIGIGQNYLGPEQLGMRERILRTLRVTGAKVFVNDETGSAIQKNLPLNHELLRDYAVKNARIITVAKSIDEVKSWMQFLIEDAPSAWNVIYDYAAWKGGNPRPHAFTLALMARELAFAEKAVEVRPNSLVYAYVFQRKGKSLLAIWSLGKETVSAKLDMPSAWSGHMLSGRKVSGKKGANILHLNDRPLYLELDAPQKRVVKAVREGHYVIPELSLSANRKFGNIVNVFIENRTARKIEADIAFSGSAAKRVPLPPMAETRIEFESAPGREWKIEATANGVKYTEKKEEELLPVERLLAPPALDGTLHGFEKVKPIILNSSSSLQPIDAAAWGYWTGPEDFSAKLYLAYDKDYFYIAADVLDDVQVSRFGGPMIWNQDCLQFAFDTENDSFDPKKDTGGYHPDDREFCMALTPEGPQNFCYTAPEGLRGRTVPDKVFVRHRNGRTVYGARIPWRYFGKLTPEPGSVFGFNAVFFDLDDPKGVISYRMEISPGISNGKSPAYFKRFQLK